MIVITGAAGFIGSNFVASLNEAGITELALCDWLETGDKWRNLAKALFHDFIAPDRLLSWLAGRSDVRAIIHMGAISDTTITDGDAVLDNNFRLSLALLDHCAKDDIPLLYASSAAVYGDGGRGFLDSMSPENIALLRPLNLYGWSKRQFDFVVADRLHRGRSLPATCVGLRFFNVFGPNEYHKGDMRSIVAKIAAPIARGESIKLFKSHRQGIGDGDQRRDFIYVKDAVRLSLALLERGGQGLFNIGSGRARSFRYLAEAVFAAIGLPPRIEYVDMPEVLREKYQYFTEASVAGLATVGLSPDCPPLAATVADYVCSHLLQEDPYR